MSCPVPHSASRRTRHDAPTRPAPPPRLPGTPTIPCPALVAIEVGELLGAALLSYEVPARGRECMRPPAGEVGT
jgi:hypothetical protein